MPRSVRWAALALFSCLLGLVLTLPATASTGDGMLLAQAPPPARVVQGQPGGQAGNNPCVQSHQRCVMMCAGAGNCVNNCNVGYAACMQQQQGGRPAANPGGRPGGRPGY
jgi:hypothetical protein